MVIDGWQKCFGTKQFLFNSLVSNIFSPYSGGSFIQFCNPGNLLFLENLLLNDLGSVGKSRKISALNEEKEEEEEWEEEE